LEAEQPETGADRASTGDFLRDASGAGDPQRDASGAGDRHERTLALAYRYLNRRDRTVSEMERHLQDRGCSAEEIEAAIELLTEQGYLDDARYARLFAEDKRELEQWGSDRIQRALLERGLDRELVEQALASGARDSEISRAVALLQRRFPSPPRDRRERERALGVLLRKGYGSELALDALVAYADCADWPPVLGCQ
jgi:regulatory protein